MHLPVAKSCLKLKVATHVNIKLCQSRDKGTTSTCWYHDGQMESDLIQALIICCLYSALMRCRQKGEGKEIIISGGTLN